MNTVPNDIILTAGIFFLTINIYFDPPPPICGRF